MFLAWSPQLFNKLLWAHCERGKQKCLIDIARQLQGYLWTEKNSCILVFMALKIINLWSIFLYLSKDKLKNNLLSLLVPLAIIDVNFYAIQFDNKMVFISFKQIKRHECHQNLENVAKRLDLPLQFWASNGYGRLNFEAAPFNNIFIFIR